MKSRIDLRRLPRDPLHAFWIVSAAVLVMIMVVTVQDQIMRRSSMGRWYALVNTVLPPLPPPMVAAGAEVTEAVHRWEGIEEHGMWRSDVTSMLTSMIAAYLIGPSLFVWGLRARSRARAAGASRWRRTVILASLAWGGASVLSLLASLPLAYEFQNTHERLVAQEHHAARGDSLSLDLFDMGRRAQVAYFVPADGGHQGRSWQSPDGTGRPSVSIAQFLAPGTDAVMTDSRHAMIDGRSYELVIDGPDTLTITGRYARPVDGDLESAQEITQAGMVLGVTPDRITMNILP